MHLLPLTNCRSEMADIPNSWNLLSSCVDLTFSSRLRNVQSSSACTFLGSGWSYWAPQWRHIAFHVCTWRFKTTIFYSLNSISDLNLPTIPFKVSSLWGAVSVPALLLLLSLDRSLEVPFWPFLGMHLQCPITTVQLECHFKEEYGVKRSSSDCKQLKMSWACSLSSGNLSQIFTDKHLTFRDKFTVTTCELNKMTWTWWRYSPHDLPSTLPFKTTVRSLCQKREASVPVTHDD